MSAMRNALYQFRDCLPFWRIALVLSILAILWLATTSNPYPMPSSPSDKVNHIIAFVELTLLARLGWPGRQVFLYAIPLLAFGLALELIQSPLDHRDFSWSDLAADAAGIAFGLLPWPLIPSHRQGPRGSI